MEWDWPVKWLQNLFRPSGEVSAAETAVSSPSSQGRPVPIEQVPALAEGWLPANISPSNNVLTSDDIVQLLTRLKDHGSSEQHVVVECTGGLTARAVSITNLVRKHARTVRVVISPFAACDLSISSSGHVGFDSRVASLLHQLQGQGSITLRAELVDAFLATLMPPRHAFLGLIEKLNVQGIRVDGLAWSRFPDAADEYSMLSFAPGHPPTYSDVWNQYGLQIPELGRGARWDEEPGSILELLPPMISISRTHTPRMEWCQRLRRQLYREYDISACFRDGVSISTHADGWRFCCEDTDELMSTSSLLERLDTFMSKGAVEVAIDPECIREEQARVSTTSAIRSLPYPYDNYLALSSDVDWSTPAQVELARIQLCEHLGLNVSGSCFLRSDGRTGVSILNLENKPLQWKYERTPLSCRTWFKQGALDTLHHVQNSFGVHEMQRSGQAWMTQFPVEPAAVHALLIRSKEDPHGHVPRLLYQGSSLEPASGSGLASEGGYITVWELEVSSSCEGPGEFSMENPADLGVSDAWLIDCRPSDVTSGLQEAASMGINPMVSTSHGGGFLVRNIANTRTETIRQRGQGITLDNDDPESPYYCLQELRELGIRFFGRIGQASTPKLTRISDLLEPGTATDDSALYYFRRYISRRHEELGLPEDFAYKKNIANSTAVEYQVNDFLERIRWAGAGYGGILYTHLGHHPGEQSQERLAWTEWTHEALRHLAIHAHGRGQVPRVWVAPTSEVLAFAAVSQAIGEHASIDGDVLQIASWHDEHLGHGIPCISEYGTRWLHGTTVYVDNPQQVQVSNDGCPITSYSCNDPDETGSKSITFVNDTATHGILNTISRKNIRVDSGNAGLNESHILVADVSGSVTLEVEFDEISMAHCSHVSIRVNGAHACIESLDFRSNNRWHGCSSNLQENLHGVVMIPTRDIEMLDDGMPPRSIHAVRLCILNSTDSSFILEEVNMHMSGNQHAQQELNANRVVTQ